MSLWYFAARTIPSFFTACLLGIHSPSGTDFAWQHAPLQPNAKEFVFIITVLYAQEILNIKCSSSPHLAFILKIPMASCVDLSMGPNTLKLKLRLELMLSLQNGTSEKDLYSKMMENKPHRISEYVEDGTYIVGAFHNRTITMEEEGAICNIVGRFDSLMSFKRLYKGHQIIQSQEYKCTQRRNNFVILYNDKFWKSEEFC